MENWRRTTYQAARDRYATIERCSHCHETKLTNPVTPKGQPLAMTALDKLAMQLAYKLARDPRGYDRDIVLRIKWFDADAIPQSQVETLAGNIRKGL